MLIQRAARQLVNQRTKVKCYSSAAARAAEAKQLQEGALEENCILVDENDRSLGLSTKRDCHRVSATGDIKLHRAFSVFLFNSKGDMLLQRRSNHKVYLKCFFKTVTRSTWILISYIILTIEFRLRFLIAIQMHVVVIRSSI